VTGGKHTQIAALVVKAVAARAGSRITAGFWYGPYLRICGEDFRPER
jgi:hypothetical protein